MTFYVLRVEEGSGPGFPRPLSLTSNHSKPLGLNSFSGPKRPWKSDFNRQSFGFSMNELLQKP